MGSNAADVLVDCLCAWDVDIVFGLPGDGINGIMEALRLRQKDIRFIQVRHEESAAFMACAYAKFTGKLGVCLATSGPGGIHLLNGLYDAKTRRSAGSGHHWSPVSRPHSHLHPAGRGVRQAARRCLPSYNARIMGPAHVENVMELACRTAFARRGVSHVTMPVDMQSMPLKSDTRSSRNVKHHVSMVSASGAPVPAEAELQQAADILNARKENLHSRRPRRPRAGSELAALAREAAGTRRQGAAWSGRHGGRTIPALHGRGRAPRYRAVAGCPAVLRHAFDRGQRISLYRALSQARAGARGADRPRRDAHRASLPGGMRPGGGCCRHAAGAGASLRRSR